MKRESFVFYRSFRDAFNALDKDVRLRMYEAVIDYGLDLIEPHFEGIEKVLWTLIRPQLEANNKRFENGCKGGNPNFKKGQPNPYYLKGEKNKKNNIKDNQKITKRQPKDNQKITERLPNVNENVNENVNDIRTLKTSFKVSSFGANDAPADPKIDFEKIKGSWNDEAQKSHSLMPKLRSMQKQRQKQIAARIREYGEEVFFDAMEKAVASDFLNGKNRRGWIASFDWFVKPTNFAKVVDGNYNDSARKVRTEKADQREQQEATDQAHDAEVEEFRSLLKRFGISATEYLKCKDLFDGKHTDEEIRREIQNKRV